ncbi:MAG: methyltransferase family protein [Methylococcaceae bacterium]
MNTILRLPPPVYALILALTSFALDQFIPATSMILSPVMGVVMVSSGLVIIALALSEFKRNGTTHLPTGEPVQFVCSGPYQWTRNPMYLGLTTLLTGFALFFGGFPLFLAPLILFFIIDRVFIPYEEGKLASIFGYVYEDYLKAVRRWL